jgi:hypothetical protein
MVVGVGQDGDPNSRLRQPPEVGEEPEPATSVFEEIRSLVPAVPAVSDHAERVACRLAGSRRRNRPHLVEPLPVEHDPALDRAAVQLEVEEPGEVGSARIETARCRHRLVERRLGIGVDVSHGAIGSRPDRAPVEGAAFHAERLEQGLAHHLRKGPTFDSLKDVAGKVDSEVRVGVPGADRKAQPRVGDAANVGIELAGVELVVVPVPRA